MGQNMIPKLIAVVIGNFIKTDATAGALAEYLKEVRDDIRRYGGDAEFDFNKKLHFLFRREYGDLCYSCTFLELAAAYKRDTLVVALGIVREKDAELEADAAAPTGPGMSLVV